MRQKFTKIPLGSFCVGCLLLGMGLAHSVVHTPNETPLEKISFSFISRCQLKIAYWLEIGAHGCALFLYFCLFVC